VLGALFGNRNNALARDELIIFLTPTVIGSDSDSNDVTDRVMRQFRTVLDRTTMPAPQVPPR
jgi:type II secretory pathway component GspD/PulD (secretin)